MLKIYYTTITEYNQAQRSIYKSLGGYKSSTVVRNDSLSNIFDELSLYGCSTAKDQYIGLILKNESKTELKDVQLWFDISEDNYCNFEIAAEQTSIDSNGNPYMSNVETIYSKPFGVQFYSATEQDKVTIGDLSPNQEVGFWIKRIVLQDKLIKDYNDVAEKDPNSENRYQKKVKKQQESVDLHIKWMEP